MFLFGFSSWPEAKDGRGLFGNNKSPIGHLFPDVNHYRLGAKRIFTYTATGNLTCETKGHDVYVPHHYESSQFKKAGKDGITHGCVKTHEYMDKLCNSSTSPHEYTSNFMREPVPFSSLHHTCVMTESVRIHPHSPWSASEITLMTIFKFPGNNRCISLDLSAQASLKISSTQSVNALFSFCKQNIIRIFILFCFLVMGICRLNAK